MLQLRRERKHSIEFWTEKEEANTVLVWCVISSFAQKSALCRVNGKFDSNNYKNILRQYVLPLSLNERIGLVHDWYPVHRSQSVNEFLAEHKGTFLLLTGQSLLVILWHLSNCGWKSLSSILKRTLKLALCAVWREKSPQCGQRFALTNLSSNSSRKFPSNFSRSSPIVVHNTSISLFISVLPISIEVNENLHYVSRLWNMLIKIGIQRSHFVFGTER